MNKSNPRARIAAYGAASTGLLLLVGYAYGALYGRAWLRSLAATASHGQPMDYRLGLRKWG